MEWGVREYCRALDLEKKLGGELIDLIGWKWFRKWIESDMSIFDPVEPYPGLTLSELRARIYASWTSYYGVDDDE